MFANESPTAASAERALRFGTIVVVGGGCYGSYYVRQLRRAARAGAAVWQRLLVVDRDSSCAVAQDETLTGEGIEVVKAEWSEFFHRYLDEASRDRATTRDDAIVPSPLMPHLMFEWIRDRARERWPDREIASRALVAEPRTPWQRSTGDGPHYVSFAEWTCPINCIEPRICPHTRDVRSWSLPDTARNYVREERRAGRPLAGPAIFHCTHRTYGVGMFDTREVIAGDDLVRAAGEHGAAEVLVGTMSHCHGALERLVIGPPAADRFAGSRH
ncbi:MAG TPA: hypothetical protein VJW73_10080 [Gemmatimonadaceae bacterium]|nr:hypothetical protein [Gemmatimonadaceae bacterium]